MEELIGSIRQIPYGPFYQVLQILDDGEVLVDFCESGEQCTLTLDEVLATPLKD